MRTKYDIGCGNEKPGKDWIGVNYPETEDADIVHDLEKGLPFDHELFEEDRATVIRLHHVIEHIENQDKLLEDIAKLADEDAEIRITVPHYLHVNSKDSDHKRDYSIISFDTYCVDHDHPTTKPQLFKMKDKEVHWVELRKSMRLLKKVMGDDFVRNHFANTVEELKFVLGVAE
ncbi:hypothetical protein GKQ38_04560 [Candidatus Nanohaloarchaea archaeon]|nr:hypothetical protein GKQ38_04560 [Candidatus Nanohaloarchaea archaeon]